jgi:hypothetical protein
MKILAIPLQLLSILYGVVFTILLAIYYQILFAYAYIKISIKTGESIRVLDYCSRFCYPSEYLYIASIVLAAYKQL